MIQLPLAFQSGDTLLAELDPDHYITDKKRVVAKLTADNLWVKPVVPIVPSEFVSIANAEHKRLTEPYRWMQEYQKTQVFKHLGGQHDQATHGRKTFNYSNAADLFGDIESLQASVEALTDPSQSAFVNGNVALKVLLERQGRNGRPEVFESMEALEAVNPDGEILYRGTDQSHKDALMNDEFGRVGTGNHGAGYYFVENQNMAQSYADGPSALGAYDSPTVVQAKMNPNAKVKSFKDSKEMHNFGREAQTKAIQDMTAIDPSAMRTGDFVLTNFYGMFDAAASTQLILEGFDAMTFDRGGGNQYTVVFNREAMQVVAD